MNRSVPLVRSYDLFREKKFEIKQKKFTVQMRHTNQEMSKFLMKKKRISYKISGIFFLTMREISRVLTQ